MGRYSRIILAAALYLFCFEAYCCTSVIISGNARADGRPVMLKHRDTRELNNMMRWFQGPEYSFIGLVNSSSKGGEVWAGNNSAGFCIMNTAAYDFKDDDLPESVMGKEGELMFKALGVCADLKDFERFLDSLPKPWGVEANFGIIDSKGEAAYYEVNNHSYRRYNVAEEPGGYMVVTNFTRNGRQEDRKGVDRFEKASLTMAGLDVANVDHKEIFNYISRSGKPIMRDISASAIVFEGVSPGEDPSFTTAWTILGCPTTCIYVPLKVFSSDHIPSFMNEYGEGESSRVCSYSLVIKGFYGYEEGCVDKCREVEKFVDRGFSRTMGASGYDRYIRKVYRKYRMGYLRKLPEAVY